jgi:hypothetical protein
MATCAIGTESFTMILLSLLGFLVLFCLGFVFVFAGLSILFWGWAHHTFEWTGVLPTLFGIMVIYSSFVLAPFTISLKVSV